MTVVLQGSGDTQHQGADLALSLPQNRTTLDNGRSIPTTPHVLMVSALYKLPYRVMRCAAATGAEVYVLGGPASRSLRRSRFCRRFKVTDTPIDGTASEQLLEEINQCVASWDIDLVLAGDAPATRALIALRERIGAPCFPMPDLESFDLLNDKWKFYQLCVSTGVLTPRTWIFRDRQELGSAFDAGTLSGKIIAKPLSQSGGAGCLVLDPENARATVRRINYAPILVQQFVEGTDIGASVYCRNGVVKAFIAHSYDRDTYRTFADARIRGDVERLLRKLGVDGVFNFDMRRDADGRIHYLECNPRFFFKIAMSMLAGLNFVAFGLGAAPDQAIIIRDRTVRLPKALICKLWTTWRIEPESWRALKFTLADPIPYFREEIGLEAGQ